MLGSRRVSLLLFLGVLLLPLAGAALPKRSQIEEVRYGWQVFNDAQCIACHTVWGEGETVGPDLGRISGEFLSAGQLAGVMWNHAPDMWNRMIARGMPVTRISEPEMEALFAFLHFIRFMDEPGNVARGEELIHRKLCVSCHAIDPGEVKIAPNFRTLGAHVNPIVWTQKMWNHAPGMYAKMETEGFDWPTFEGDEMVDLLAYLESIVDAGERVYLEPGDHVRGREAFVDRGCVGCHEDNPASGAPQLNALAQRPRTVSQMAGLMWNHAPDMVELMQSEGLPWSTISAQEMADLITYFFSIRFYEQTGDPVAGKTVFFNNRCNVCHVQTGIARTLAQGQDGLSPIRMAQLMWNHGLEMREKMEELRVPWPVFGGNEMADLLAYVNSAPVPDPSAVARPAPPEKSPHP